RCCRPRPAWQGSDNTSSAPVDGMEFNSIINQPLLRSAVAKLNAAHSQSPLQTSQARDNDPRRGSTQTSWRIRPGEGVALAAPFAGLQAMSLTRKLMAPPKGFKNPNARII